MKDILVSIDPGLAGTGYAIWASGKLRDAGVLNAGREAKDFFQRGMLLAEKVEKLLRGVEHAYPCQTIRSRQLAVEYPKFFQSAVGETAARSGDLVKLSWFVGLVCGTATSWGFEPLLVPVNDWKGQLPKEVVITRIQGKMPEVDNFKIKSHAWDAVGIGMFVLGKF